MVIYTHSIPIGALNLLIFFFSVVSRVLKIFSFRVSGFILIIFLLLLKYAFRANITNADRVRSAPRTPWMITNIFDTRKRLLLRTRPHVKLVKRYVLARRHTCPLCEILHRARDSDKN